MARAMMKVQMEHALTRLREAFDDILGEPPRRPEPNQTAKERADLIRSGKVKVTKAMINTALENFDRQYSRGGYVESIERRLYNEIDRALDAAYKPKTDPAVAKYNARRKKLEAKYREAKDEIILGDVDRALKLIAAFAKTKV